MYVYREETMTSGNSSDHPDKTFLPGGGQTPLLLTPASLQLAQLQAQLTLHRLKLAQSAVSGNTAAAATVLNQVLSNVAMSQPLFNQLRSSAIVSTPHGQAGGAQLGPRFPSGSLTYQPQSSGLGALVGGGFGCGGNVQGINPGSFRPNCYGGSQGHSDYGKKAGPASNSTFSADSDRRAQYGFLSGTSAPGGKPNDGQYVPISSQAESGNQGGFQRDFFGSDGQSQQPGFSGQRNSDSFSSGRHTEQWHSVGNFSYTGKLDMAPSAGSAGSVWAPSGQQFNVRSELYNPEEPTTDPKYNSVCGSAFGPSAQGFMGYQPAEEGLSGVPTPLLPHQLNDFHAVTPSHLPHHCTICDKKVYNLKDWDQHVKGKLHLQNRSLYVEGPAGGSVHYPPSTESCLTSSANNSMAHATAANQDASPGASSGFLPAAQMMSAGYPLPPPTGSKFIQRKSSTGRVVHICNLPEGSCTENDVINLGLPFGKVTNYILMRSTHQAFLEMAYIEAAQAMVQYYQLNPATVNDQKLLIRMSKRYQELQLKKPGKDVESIIQDINSQREREELQEIENYPPERARSRSPVSRSLSPRSHSPSFTSCSSAHSPPWGNGLGPRRASWDWSSHMRDEACWRNGDEDRPNGRLQDRRKPYLKPADRMSPRSVEEWAEGLRGGRDRYCKGSPQGPPFPSYRSKEEDFYKKEPAYKLDKLPRAPYQRHEMKPKRRDLSEHHRSRHLEPEAPEDSEDRKLTPPLRGKSKKSTWKQEVEKDERGSESYGEKAGEPRTEEKSGLPAQTERERDKDSEAEEWKSGDEKEEESWYPKNMEELVTVDEVGEEDDGLIEPDLPDLLEQTSVKDEDRASTQTAAGEASEKEVLQCETGLKDPAGPEPHLQEGQEGAPPDADPQKLPTASRQPTSKLGCLPSQDCPAPLEEMSSSTDGDKPDAQSPKDCPANHKDVCDGAKPVQRETGKMELGAKAKPSEIPRRDEGFGETPKKETTQSQTDVVAKPVPLTSLEQDKAISEHSIPLGVEFIVPRSGFYCKLCDLFYTSEETAKTAHCRSTVHYRNLQKYLSQLAEESLPDTNSGPAGAE